MRRLFKSRLIFLVAVLVSGGLVVLAPTASGLASHRQAKQPPTAPVMPSAPASQPADPSSGDEEVVFDPSDVTVEPFPVPPGVDKPQPAAAQPAQPAAPESPPTTAAPPAAPQIQAPTVQTTPTTTTAAEQTVTKAEQTTPQPSPPPVTTQAELPATPPPPPLCLNHPDFPKVPDGWQRSKDGNCNEIPKLDLVLSGPATITAPGGTANFTMTIVNNGSNRASGVLFKEQLDANGNLSLVDLKASQGDPYGKVDDRTFVCSIGTIMPGQSATVSISLKAAGTGSVTVGAVEPGGEADTNTDNNHLVTTVVLTAAQTQQTVQLHGLLWGNKYYGSVTVFTRKLVEEGITWRGWKKTHPALASGLVTHQGKLSRRH